MFTRKKLRKMRKIMIIIQLLGNLCNQMFQYDIGCSCAYRLNTHLKLDTLPFQNYKYRKYNILEFNIFEIFALDKDHWLIRRLSTPVRIFFADIHCLLSVTTGISYKRESYFHFDPDFLELPEDIYLEDYWQSAKYFKNLVGIIRRVFTPCKEFVAFNEHVAEKTCESNASSIHIQSGNYIAKPLTYNHHGLCPFEYYQMAIDCKVTNISNHYFYIFSNDPLWVEQNLIVNYSHTYVVTHNQNIRYSLDLWLMSLCKHNIIVHISYSWWGAWLSDNLEKIVIAKKNWFNTPDIDGRDPIPDFWFVN